VYVPAEPIQLGDSNGALEFLCSRESGLELRAAVEGIGAFAGLDLNELPDQLQSLGFREPAERLTLGFNAEPGASLP
jgi:hypothetical protein